MKEIDDIAYIALMIWLLALVHTGIVLYNKFAQKAPKEEAVLYTSDLHEGWKDRVKKIKKDQKGLMEQYKQRQKDQKRLSATVSPTR